MGDNFVFYFFLPSIIQEVLLKELVKKELSVIFEMFISSSHETKNLKRHNTTLSSHSVLKNDLSINI